MAIALSSTGFTCTPDFTRQSRKAFQNLFCRTLKLNFRKEKLNFAIFKSKYYSDSGLRWRRIIRKGFDGDHRFESHSVLDRCLAVAEVACIAPSFVLSVAFAVQCLLRKSQNVNLYVSWQVIPMLGAVIIGSMIRTRQWNKITAVRSSKGSLNSEGTDILSLAQRVRNLEEDVGSSVTIVRVLSRQLEKLGVRFRITRRTLRDPINEAADLAQKTAVALRALAMQEDALEKELRESQQIMLAMQEQQQKQLELILSLGKVVKQLRSTFSHANNAKKPDQADDFSSTQKPKMENSKVIPY
eukprot:TRINITY_DN40526_c0_g1_i1.p1 TRINITY_DN40526_c0_g1~~TRINITY_DN40526_c0_g1_i1.p1  ORF type:complete len:299 (-),score=49.67 TRINITY_DN40526_c0_g1_i1:479-1375(-)